MDSEIRQYLSEIGRRWGKKSRRRLSRGEARRMVLIREARRAFRNFKTECFWSSNLPSAITDGHLAWVIGSLKRYGGRAADEAAWKLEALQERVRRNGASDASK